METTERTVQVAGRYDCYLAGTGQIQVLDTRRNLANWVSITELGRGVLEVTNLHTGTLHTLVLPDHSRAWECDCQAGRKGLPWCYHRAAAVAVSQEETSRRPGERGCREHAPTFFCPACRRSLGRAQVRQAERDEVCLYVCHACGTIVDEAGQE